MMLASITCNERGSTDRLLSSAVARLSDEGYRVLGALRATEKAGSDHCSTSLRLLPDGPVVALSQHLGTGSTACRLDASAMEDAVGLVSARLASEGCDLVVLNKFGLSEAEGRGFRSFVVEALGRDIPVLMGLAEAHRVALERFADGMATALPPDEDAIIAWCRKAADCSSPFVQEA